ncbi:hypothetical protein NHF48_001920 [Sphingomonas sp. H160509]|uniref:hypothetical protein n=1 Tax=Sphingomonas sp. H160509 TaxID=2955313 RepID=UPI0020982180|nr:hypothetical protein [Sphingomonas sp. H160509]MDD1449982.1 hypothetical protein [Sphingomonas sp. H160509]
MNDKLGRQAPYRVCDVDALTHIVVEHDATDRVVRAMTETGATLVRADPQASRALT